MKSLLDSLRETGGAFLRDKGISICSKGDPYNSLPGAKINVDFHFPYGIHTSFTSIANNLLSN